MRQPAIRWQHFPKSIACPSSLSEVVKIFESCFDAINSKAHEGQSSDQALSVVRPFLVSAGFMVEQNKSKEGKIRIPVHYGEGGIPTQAFEADAYHPLNKIVLEVEAGRAVVNFQFLKDLFQACVMQDVDYLAIAVRQDYRGMNDFEKVVNFLETLHSSDRLKLPLKGILVIGY